MPAEEQTRLHRVPNQPHIEAFGLARRVPLNTPMVTFEYGPVLGPQRLLREQVWVRARGLAASEVVTGGAAMRVIAPVLASVCGGWPSV
jgi:hypothetical protein